MFTATACALRRVKQGKHGDMSRHAPIRSVIKSARGNKSRACFLSLSCPLFFFESCGKFQSGLEASSFSPSRELCLATCSSLHL